MLILVANSVLAQFIPKSINAISFKINTVMLTGKTEGGKDTIIDMTDTFKLGNIIAFRDSTKHEMIGIDKGEESLVFLGYLKKIRKTGDWRHIPGRLYKFTDNDREYENIKIIIDVNEDQMDENGNPSYVFVMYFINDNASMIFFTNLINTFPISEKVVF